MSSPRGLGGVTCLLAGMLAVGCGGGTINGGATTGTAGSAGAAGTGGSAGSNGSAGSSGSAGSGSSAGNSGSAGSGGSAGAVGTASTSGVAGTHGSAGSTGAAGASGAAGTHGSAGSTGAAGITGTAGGSAAGATGTAGGGAAGTAGGADPLAAARQACVDKINAFRATLSLAVLTRWTAEEACTDAAAKSDSETGKAHGAFGTCTEGAQDECPGWGSVASITATGGCLDDMWAEGPGADYAAHGHYINMSNSKYTKVACGFYTTPAGKVWAVQNLK